MLIGGEIAAAAVYRRKWRPQPLPLGQFVLGYGNIVRSECEVRFVCFGFGGNLGVVSPGENRGEIFVLGRRPQTNVCCCCDTGEFCTDLILIPLAGVDAGVVDPLPIADPT